MADFNLSNARILSPGVVATPIDAVPKERSFFGNIAEGLKTAKDLQDYWKQENDIKKRDKLLTDFGNLEDDGSIAELDRQIAAIEARLNELDQMQKDIETVNRMDNILSDAPVNNQYTPSFDWSQQMSKDLGFSPRGRNDF